MPPLKTAHRAKRTRLSVEDAEDSSSQSLVKVCEPFFAAICDLIREGSQAQESCGVVHKRLSGMLDAMHDESLKGHATLAADYAAIEPALAFLADDLIVKSDLPFANEWRVPALLANHRRISVVNGHQVFFNMLNAELNSASRTNSERLAIYGQCLGLGFGGAQSGNVSALQGFAANIRGKIDGNTMSLDLGEEICPEAYATDEHVIYHPVRERLIFIGVMLAALMLGTCATWYWIAQGSQQQIESTLGEVVNAKN